MQSSEQWFAKSLAEIGQHIQNKDISASELVKSLLERIHREDKKLNAFITINEDALRTAKDIDKEIIAGKYKGPLHGIPIGVKDIINTKNMKTTMGSKIFDNYVPTTDATVIQRLRQAGAIIIGKLNTHQMAYGPTGDRSYYGAVKNPHDLTKMSGGSSSGSGAAVAACLCYGALGTDTGGSIRIPASFCGIVGMKPTYGTVSKRGSYPLAWSLDHIGPMTRSIQDNAILMNAIQGYDDEDPDAIYREREDFTRLIGKSIDGLTIGIPKQFYFDNIDEEVGAAIDDAIHLLEKLGAHIIDVDLLHMDEILAAQRVVIRSEAYAVNEQHLKNHPDDWDDEVKERLMTAHQDKGFDYVRAIRTRPLAKQSFNSALTNADALLAPTIPLLPLNINQRHLGDDEYEEDNHIRSMFTKLTGPTDLNGFPSLSMPCGFSANGMPIGLQFIGREYDEAKLYQIGYALEQELGLDLAKLTI